MYMQKDFSSIVSNQLISWSEPIQHYPTTMKCEELNEL